MRKVPMMMGLLGGAAAAMVIAIYAVKGADRKTPPTQPIEYRVPVPAKPVLRRTVPIFLDYVGTTEAIRTVTLQAKVAGYVARQAVGKRRLGHDRLTVTGERQVDIGREHLKLRQRYRRCGGRSRGRRRVGHGLAGETR